MKNIIILSLIFALFSCEQSESFKTIEKKLSLITNNYGDTIRFVYEKDKISSIIEFLNFENRYEGFEIESSSTKSIIYTTNFIYKNSELLAFDDVYTNYHYTGEYSNGSTKFQIEKHDDNITLKESNSSNLLEYKFQNNLIIVSFTSSNEPNIEISYFFNEINNIDSTITDDNNKIVFLAYDSIENPYKKINELTGFPFYLESETISNNNPTKSIRFNTRNTVLLPDTIYYEYSYSNNMVLRVDRRIVSTKLEGDLLETKNKYEYTKFIYSE